MEKKNTIFRNLLLLTLGAFVIFSSFGPRYDDDDNKPSKPKPENCPEVPYFSPRHPKNVAELVKDGYWKDNSFLVRGNFLNIGNSNQTLSESGGGYNGKENNSNNWMYWVKDDQGRVNSSMAPLNLKGGKRKVIYAGLYWVGRYKNKASNDGREKVKFGKGGRDFSVVTADLKTGGQAYEIATVASNTKAQMYVAYADVTEKVKALGEGNYYVADIISEQGKKGDATGDFAGWGMMVVYEDETEPWRDITLFDGYAHVIGGTACHTLNVSGFRAVKEGNVAVDMSFMAMEGDQGITGDYFQVEESEKSTIKWKSLSHGANSADNFFNSSITFEGSDKRFPIGRNALGLDIARFTLDNKDNKIIANDANSVKFKYGSTQDTYVIFSIGLAVEAYVPNLVASNKVVRKDQESSTIGTIDYTSTIPMRVDLQNKGDEDLKDVQVNIAIPSTVHLQDFAIASQVAKQVEGLTVRWEAPSYAGATADSKVTPGGRLVITATKVKKGAKNAIETVLAGITYNLKPIANCRLYSGSECVRVVQVSGDFKGTGIKTERTIQGAVRSGVGAQGTEAIVGQIKPTTCGEEVFYNACGLVSLSYESVAMEYPKGTKFYSQVPVSFESEGMKVGTAFETPENSNDQKLYYAMLPGMDAGCYLTLTFEKRLCPAMINPVINSGGLE